MSDSDSDIEQQNAGLAPPEVEEKDVLFSELKLEAPLLEAIDACGWKKATPIQRESLPEAMAGDHSWLIFFVHEISLACSFNN